MADTLDRLVAQNSGSQPARTAAGAETQNTQDLLDQLVSNQQKLDQLSQAQKDVPGTSDFLRSLPGILAMLGTGGLAAAGQSEAAAGFGQGLLGQVAADQKMEQKLIGQDRKQVMEMLKANQQRLTTMINTRPEIFVDDEGNSLVDERVLMYAATGYALPINPGINYRLSKQNERTKRMVTTGRDLLIRGDTPAKRKQGGMMIERALGVTLGDQFFQDIMGQDQTKQWESLLGKKTLDPLSTLHAWKYAMENGKSLADPEVIGMLAGAVTPAKPVTLDDTMIGLAKTFSQRVEEAGPAVQNLPFDQQIDYVFANTQEGEAALFRKYFMGTDIYDTGLGGQALLSMIVNAGDLISTVYRANPNSPWLKSKGINNPEDIYSSKGVGSVLESGVAWAQEAMRDNTAQNFGVHLRNIAERIAVDNPDVTEASLADYALQRLNEIKASVTSATGRVDVDAFNQKVQEYVEGDTESE